MSDLVASVLEQRAAELARPLDEDTSTTPHLVVHVGGRRVQVPAARVRHVDRVAALAAAPGAPPSIVGIAAVLGQVAPVVRLGALLGDGAEADGADVLVAVDDGIDLLALAVDAVEGIVEVDDTAVRAPLATGLLVDLGPDVPHVLDVDRLLEDPRLSAAPERPISLEGAT